MFGMDRIAGRIVAGLIAVALLCLIGFGVSYCSGRDRLAKDRHQTENATGKALDRVSTETADIHADQQEKQREVETIPGSDTRLPDGYGADLQRVRERERRHP